MVAEGAYEGGINALAQGLEQNSDYEVRTTILGHIQRGGAPSAYDRVLASKLGYFAVQALKEGKSDVMVGKSRGDMIIAPLRNAWETRKEIDLQLYTISEILAT